MDKVVEKPKQITIQKSQLTRNPKTQDKKKCRENMPSKFQK